MRRRIFSGGCYRWSASVAGAAFFVALAAGSVVLADDDEEPVDIWEESVVVSASRYEQPIEDVAANATVLGEDDARRTAALTSDDFLRQVPGFSLFRRSSSLTAHPTSQGVSLRGIGPSGVSRTVVLLDGIPLNDPFGGWVYWSRVPVESLQRVEVVRGGASSLWGSSALGGVVQLFTRDPETGTASFRAELGNRETVLLDASFDERWQRSGIHVGLNYFDTDGFHVVAPEFRGDIDVHATSEHFNGGLRYNVDLGDSSRLVVRGDYFDEERGNGTPLTDNDTESATVSLRWTRVGSGSGEWRLGVFGHDQEFSSFFSAQAADRDSETPANDQYLVDSEGFGLGLEWVRGYGSDQGHLIAAGGELRTTDGTTNENFFWNGESFNFVRRAGGDQQLAGIYLQDTWSGERWQVQIGARGDRWEAEDGFRSETSLETGIPRLDLAFEDRSETELSPRIAGLYAASDVVTLRGSVYESFRAPSINELYRPFRVRNDITAANEELVPEELLGAELGANFTGRSTRGKLTGFWNEVDDAIANVTVGVGPGVVGPCGFTPGGGACRQRQNLDKTRVYGIEAEIEYRLSNRFRFLATYLYADTEILEASNQPELEGNRIAQVPKNQATAQMSYLTDGGLSVALQGRVADDQFEDDLNTRSLDRYVVFDVVADQAIGDRWNVFVRVENVFDEEIETGMTEDGLVSIGNPFLVHGGFRVRVRH